MSVTDFQCLTTLPAARARVEFAGLFEGREVRWRMTLSTLQSYVQNYAFELASREQGPTGALAVRSFIEVHPETASGREIEVALPLDCIDEAAIQKAIIMVRQYRRLKEGRHEFGETLVFNCS